MPVVMNLSGPGEVVGGRCGSRRGGAWDPGPLPEPHFETQIFAIIVTPLRDVGKISAGPPITQILDPHLGGREDCQGYREGG